MSLRQWIEQKFLLIKRKNKGSDHNTRGVDHFFVTQTPELSAAALKEHLIVILIACGLAIGMIPLMYLIPKLYDDARATTWVITEDIMTANDVGRAMSITSSTDGLPAVVFYDKTNFTAKYAQRESAGTWTVESIETFTSDYGFGNTDNIKFDIARDPSDNKMSVVYCKYGGTASVRLAHRVGDGSGNCGTSNNWTCSSVDSTAGSCDMRMFSLQFHATSSQPTVATVETFAVDYYEYNGSSWTQKTHIGSPNGWGLDYDEVSVDHAFTTSTNQPIIFYVNQNALTGQDDEINDGRGRLHYIVRNSDWTWTKRTIDNWGDDANGVRTVSVIRDASGYFYFAYTAPLAGLRYGTLKGSNLATSTITSAVSSTWASIGLNSSNNPSVAYYDTTNLDLKLASYSGSWSIETVSSTDSVGDFPSLYLSSDSPVIAYRYVTNNNASFISATAFNTAPTAPTTPYSNSSTAQSGSSNPTNLATGTPAFSALFQDPDTGNTAAKAEIQVTTSSDGFVTVTHWDSGSSGNTISSVAIGARSQDLVYNNFGTSADKTIGIADDGTEGTNTSYNWRIRFWDNSGLSGTWSATQTFSILDRPLAPSAMTVPLSTTTATPAWTDNSSIEQRVQVAISTDGSTYSHHASSTAASQTSSSTTDLTPNTLYYFKARAWNDAGYSSYSTATSGYTLANVPTALIASSTAYDRVNTAWGANNNPSGTEYYAINVTAGTNSGWITTRENLFTGLEGAKAYSFQVRARNGGSIATEYTSVVSTTTLPNTPSSLTLTQSGTSVVASWSANGNSSSATYTVQNYTSNVDSGQQSALTYTFTGLTLGSTYDFRVKAHNGDSIESAWAATSTITLANSAGGAGNQGKIEQQQQAAEAAKDAITGLIKIVEGVSTGFTSSTQATLNFRYSSNVEYMMVANDPGFDNAQWIPAQLTKKWILVGGTGSRTVYVKFKSFKSNVSDVFADSVTLDQTPPPTPTITAPADGAQLSNEKITYAGFGEVGATIAIEISRREDGSSVETYSAETDSSGAWSYTSNVPLAPDDYVLSVRAVDRADNSSEATRRAFNLTDSTPPSPPSVEFPVNLSIVETSTGTFITKGTGEPSAKIIMVRDNILTYETTVSDRGKWEFEFLVPFGEGRHTLKYFSTDQSKNQSTDVNVLFGIQIVEQKILQVEPTQPQSDEEVVILDRETEEGKPVLPPTLSHKYQSGSSAASGGGGAPAPTPSGGGAGGPVQGGGSTLSDPSAGGNTAFGPPSPTIDIVGGAGVPSDTGLTETFEALADAFNRDGLAGAAVVAAENTKKAFVAAGKTTVRAAKAVRKVADTPQVQTANTVAVVPTTAAVAAASVAGAVNGSQVLIYFKFLFTQPLMLLMRRRRKGWGVVYNAISKMPIDLAVVRMIDAKQGRVVQSRVTDQHGRYQFFAQPGEYSFEITKPEFVFPPQYMKGKNEDGAFTDLYTGGSIALAEPIAIRYNMPADPAGVAAPTASVLKDAAKKHLARIASLGGVIMTGVSFIITPTPLVGAFLVGHIGSFFVFRRLANRARPHTFGVIYDAATHTPIEKAVVRIFDTQYNKLLETQVTDSKGRYAFLVGKNTYYVLVERVGYEKMTSQPIEIKNETEAGVVAVDVLLKHEPSTIEGISVVPSADVAIAVAEPTPHEPEKIVASRYVSKETIPTQEKSTGIAATLMTSVGSGKPAIPPQSTPISSEVRLSAASDMVAFKKVAGMTESMMQMKGQTLVASGAVSKLLAPVGFGSRDLVITGLPSDVDELPEIVSDGNFLQGIKK